MAQTLTEGDIARVFPELSEISDEKLRHQVGDIWVEMAAEMGWDSLEEIPKNTTGEAGRTLVGHIRGVTQMALQICEIAKKLQGKPYDRDTMLAIGLLHDVSKLVEYEPDPAVSKGNQVPRAGRKSRMGKHIQHAVYAAHKMFSRGMSPELVNLVITHTHSSNMRGTTWEAAALFYADFADSDAGLSTGGAKMFSERWRLHDE